MQLVPLSEKDLLTKTKVEQITKAKLAKKQEKYQKSLKTDKLPKEQPESQDQKVKNKNEITQPVKKTPTIPIKTDKQKQISSAAKESIQKEKIASKKRHLEELENSELVLGSTLENREDDIMDTGVGNDLKQFPLESEQLAIKNNSE